MPATPRRSCRAASSSASRSPGRSVNEPMVLLADEPTGALDSRTGQEIMAIFQRLNRERGLTIVLVTHEADIAAYADRIVTFRDGRVVADLQSCLKQLCCSRDGSRLPCSAMLPLA